MQQRRRDKIVDKITDKLPEWKEGKVVKFEIPMFIGCVVASLIFVSCESKAHEHEIEIPQYNDVLLVENIDTTTLLTLNLFHESRGEGDLANMMVLATVFNRVQDKHYPNSVEEVVKQRYQYSWLLDGKSDAVGYNVIEVNRYKELYKLTEQFILEKQNWLAVSMGVNHYHTTSISPKWSRSERMVEKFKIDQHIFYKRK
ncbi:putative TMhelix containing protein [Vibrio phage 496E54-1]|nr:putative TMhelix containing protein [Vibrio phage 496E54-1]